MRDETTAAVVTQPTPVHQWVHTGSEVLLLKCVPTNGRTFNDFQWPLTVGAEVAAPDWDPTPECGHGLHGWPWGLSIGEGKDPDWSATWLVFAAKPEDVIDLGGKAKARAGRIVFVGDWQAAANVVRAGQIAWVLHRTQHAPHRDGSGAASSATGDWGASSATGDYGASSATGACSLAGVTGLNGRVRGGQYGVVALAWWNHAQKRAEMRCARIGCGDGSDGLLKAGVWYQLDEAGAFVERK